MIPWAQRNSGNCQKPQYSHQFMLMYADDTYLVSCNKMQRKHRCSVRSDPDYHMVELPMSQGTVQKTVDLLRSCIHDQRVARTTGNQNTNPMRMPCQLDPISGGCWIAIGSATSTSLTLLIRRTIIPTSLSIAVEPSVPDIEASEDICSVTRNQNCLPLCWTFWKMKGLTDDCPVRMDPRHAVPSPCKKRPGII